MAEGAQGRGEIKDLLRRHGLQPRKALGQHFLADPNLIRKLVRLAAVGPGSLVLEVGAGTGTLTAALAAAGARVRAYEIDERLRPVLAETVGDAPGVEIRFRDVMGEDVADLAADVDVMVSNLPYNVGTPLLLQLLQDAPDLRRYVVMVQREVAERLAAGPGSRLYGLPSVVAGLYAGIEQAFRVGPQVFVPPPQVDSAVVVLHRRDDVDEALAAAAMRLASAAFGQRRKMLRRSLGGLVAEDTFTRVGIDPECRPETLAPERFLLLAEAVGDAG